MKYYSISYDLNKQGKNYEGLYEAIKNFDYYHVMDSVWFIKTNFTALEIYNKLKTQIDADDFLFVSEINSNYYGFLQKKCMELVRSLIIFESVFHKLALFFLCK